MRGQIGHAPCPAVRRRTTGKTPFGNDAASTANDFRSALEFSFDGVFEQIVFAITDWSPERMFLGPFCKAFGELNNPNRGLPLS